MVRWGGELLPMMHLDLQEVSQIIPPSAMRSKRSKRGQLLGGRSKLGNSEDQRLENLDGQGEQERACFRSHAGEMEPVAPPLAAKVNDYQTA